MMYTVGGYLFHHGILGQKWGKQNGPPYPLGPGEHSAAERKAGYKKSIGGGRNESLYDRNRNKKRVEKIDSSNKKNRLTDDQKRKLKKGIAITAAALAAIGGTYLVATKLDKEATKRLIAKSMDRADQYFKETVDKRRLAQYMNNVSDNFKLRGDSTVAKDLKLRADIYQRDQKVAFDKGVAEEIKARYPKFTKKEKIDTIKEMIKKPKSKIKESDLKEKQWKEIWKDYEQRKNDSYLRNLLDQAKKNGDKESVENLRKIMYILSQK